MSVSKSCLIVSFCSLFVFNGSGVGWVGLGWVGSGCNIGFLCLPGPCILLSLNVPMYLSWDLRGVGRLVYVCVCGCVCVCVSPRMPKGSATCLVTYTCLMNIMNGKLVLGDHRAR